MSLRTASLALITGLALAAPGAALAAPEAPVAAHVEKTAAPAPAAQQEQSQYADREKADQKVANYEGGQVIVYMSGAALVALILILLLI